MSEISSTNSVSIPVSGYLKMIRRWELIEDLLGDTEAMRAAGEKWLPRESKESLSSYDDRMKRSILFNGYADTISKLCDKPFSRQVVVNNLPLELEYLMTDVDGTGKSFNLFAREVLENLLNYGISHVFVDHTRIPIDLEGRVLTKQDEIDLGMRVYLNNISPVNLIGWQTNESINIKVPSLTQIRIKKNIFEATSSFGHEEVEYILVYQPFNYVIYKKIQTKTGYDYIIVDSGDISLGKIPLVTAYANKEGMMIAKPPLMTLAWLNLGHWQSSSDHKNILRFSRFGLLFGRGIPKKMIDEGAIEIGPSKAILTESDSADLHYVESSGAGLQVGRQDLLDIQNQMESVGQQPLIKNMPDITATGQRIDSGRNISRLQFWVRATEAQLLDALKLACEWRKIRVPEDLGVDIYDEFESELGLDSADKNLVFQLQQSNIITKKTLLEEMKKRNVLSYNLDVETELVSVEEDAVKELEKYVQQQEIQAAMQQSQQQSEEEIESEE